jgi:hypothetical protein
MSEFAGNPLAEPDGVARSNDAPGIGGGSPSPRRGPGRPRKSDAAGSGAVDIGTLNGSDGDGGNAATGRTRASPGTGKKKAAYSIGGIETTLLSVHTMLAGFLGNPTLAIDPKEARLLAEGIVAVQNQYPNILMSDKQQAWFLLGGAMATVYGPRLFVMKAQMSAAKKKEAQKPVPPVSNIVHMPNTL